MNGDQDQTTCSGGSDRRRTRLLFAHDNRFIRHDGQIWSEGQFGADGWERYLDQFDKLTVVGREGRMPDRPLGQLTRSSRRGVAFHIFRDLSNLRSLLRPGGQALRDMRALVRDHDAVIARLPSEMGQIAAAAARLEGKPCCVEIVGCPWDGLRYYGGAKARLYAPLAAARLRRAARRSDHVSYVTSDFLQRRYPSRATNLLSASDVALPPPDPTVLTERLRRATGDMISLGVIGTLKSRSKGVQLLMRALARARADLPPLQLRVLGQGDLEPWRREAAELGVGDLVRFDGTLPRQDQVLRWLDTIDIYLQPSLQEGLPRALIEAMSRGCPAIASTAGGIPELLPPEDLVKPGDEFALAELLVRRIANRDWMARSATRNWERARDFDPILLDQRRERFWRTFRRASAAAPSILR